MKHMQVISEVDYWGDHDNCLNYKMLEYDWLLIALIYGVIGCFRSKLSNLTCPITNICNETGQIGQLSRQ